MKKNKNHFFLAKVPFVTFLVCILFLVCIFFGNNFLAKAEATVPSPVYLAPCPSCSVTPTVYQASPSNAPVSNNPQPSTTSSYPTTSTANPSTSQSPNPSSSPCQTSQLSVNSQSSGSVQTYDWGHRGGGGGHRGNKYHASTGNGYLQQIIQFLLQLLQLLFKQLGINLPISTTPCNTASPSSSPSSGGGSGGGTSPSGYPISGQPSSGGGSGGGGGGGGAGTATTGPTTQPGTTSSPTGSAGSSTGTSATTCTGNGTSGSVSLSGYTLVNCEDFNETNLSAGTLPSGWSAYSGGGSTTVGTGRTPSQCDVANGVVTLTQNSSGATCGIASSFGQQYGLWEARMRAYTTGSGSGSAPHPVLILWPDSNNWPSGGEYDYAETDIGSPMNAYFHCATSSGGNCATATSNVDYSQWHNYAIKWTATSVTGYIDGKEWITTTAADALAPGSMHQTIQLDNLSGQTPVDPGIMQVDWVHVYK